ncbi:MAG TPA: UDP-N-acetylglucosamine 2-epimerase (non-hydrolyzing) [Deltaproteobacteria bacterium]|nr:UDP-N-acetylglucosamine 2-epimerase (non-hydrolyzing) [Deltaproteobacteria bacterium]
MILHVVGARPQFIKLAPVLEALREQGLASEVLHTGQHYDFEMSELLFRNLGLPEPRYNLGIGSGTHAQQTGGMLCGIEEVLNLRPPALLLVYGDTNSTLAGALAACKLGIPVGHVEAGLRSFDRRMPEEINRVVADHLSTYHFCPTATAVALLKAEGIDGLLTGDVMVDALQTFSRIASTCPCPAPFVLATIHRAENTDDPGRFLAIWEALKAIAREIPVYFPIHPRTRTRYRDVIEQADHGVTAAPPAGYLDMLAMIKQAEAVITDSGGVQKEAFLLRTPCLTVRQTTEWPETIEAGWNRLVEADSRAIVGACRDIRASAPPVPTSRPFGDGAAADRIARFIKDVLA